MVGRTNVLNSAQGGIFLVKAGTTTSAEIESAMASGKYPVLEAADVFYSGTSAFTLRPIEQSLLPYICKGSGVSGETVTIVNGQSVVQESYSYTSYVFAAYDQSGKRYSQELIVDETHGTEHWGAYFNSGASVVMTSRKINGKALSADITLTPSDIGITNKLKLGNTYLTEQNVIDLLALLNNST